MNIIYPITLVHYFQLENIKYSKIKINYRYKLDEVHLANFLDFDQWKNGTIFKIYKMLIKVKYIKGVVYRKKKNL